MAKLSKSQLTTLKREEVITMLMEYLTEMGEDVVKVGGNSFSYPSVDAENNELFVKITVSVPRGSRLDGEAYDGYSEAEAYQLKQQENAEKKAQREKEKAEAAAKRAKKQAEAKAKKEEENRRREEAQAKKEEEEKEA